MRAGIKVDLRIMREVYKIEPYSSKMRGELGGWHYIHKFPGKFEMSMSTPKFSTVDVAAALGALGAVAGKRMPITIDWDGKYWLVTVIHSKTGWPTPDAKSKRLPTAICGAIIKILDAKAK